MADRQDRGIDWLVERLRQLMEEAPAATERERGIRHGMRLALREALEAQFADACKLGASSAEGLRLLAAYRDTMVPEAA